jgi:hypothetical protein
LLTSNLSAKRKKTPLASINIARALALIEDGRSIRYAANAIGAPLTAGDRAVRKFQETSTVSSQEDLDLVEKEQPHTLTIDF